MQCNKNKNKAKMPNGYFKNKIAHSKYNENVHIDVRFHICCLSIALKRGAGGNKQELSC